VEGGFVILQGLRLGSAKKFYAMGLAMGPDYERKVKAIIGQALIAYAENDNNTLSEIIEKLRNYKKKTVLDNLFHYRDFKNINEVQKLLTYIDDK